MARSPPDWAKKSWSRPAWEAWEAYCQAEKAHSHAFEMGEGDRQRLEHAEQLLKQDLAEWEDWCRSPQYCT